MAHFVALGNTACDFLESFNQSHIYRTFVCSSERNHIPWEIEYIKWDSPKNYFLNTSWFNDDINLPESLRIRLMKYTNNVIISCLGGYSGTLLTKAILNYKWPALIHFEYLIFIPFIFVDEKRGKLINEFRKAYEYNHSITFLPLPAIDHRNF